MSNYWAYTWYLFEYLEESIMQAIVGQLKDFSEKVQTFRGYRLFVLKNIGENVFSKLDPLSDKEKSGRNFL
ncbi:hypothetical protein T06_8800 [Trichinella sp. T6]|nr:hypothetical protein T06_9361 [Trichinella sp. T6]KRX57141.1 hypothetical protein T06_8800 [Trichinella sp. T6]